MPESDGLTWFSGVHPPALDLPHPGTGLAPQSLESASQPQLTPPPAHLLPQPGSPCGGACLDLVHVTQKPQFVVGLSPEPYPHSHLPSRTPAGNFRGSMATTSVVVPPPPPQKSHFRK